MIHSSNPFADPPEDRDPVRRFRGRLVAGVTIVTSGGPADRSGLTVSSLNVVEGDPGQVHLVLGPTTDVWHAIESTGKFIVHILSASHRHLAEEFAGIRPSPGGLFSGLEVDDSEWGAIITDLPNRAMCSVLDMKEAGYGGVVVGSIDQATPANLDDPLVYFRGTYRTLT